jgi:hypothetical protein
MTELVEKEDNTEHCTWCAQRRPVTDGVATVHLPELDNTWKEQPASARTPMRLCAGCLHFHETQDYLRKVGHGPPVHDAVLYADAARAGFFTQWGRDAAAISEDDIETLLEMFFSGIDVTICRVDYGPARRRGFDVTLNSLPEHQIVFAGEDRSRVPFAKQVIAVQTRDNFHASTMGLTTARALAVGLNVFVRRMAITERRWLERDIERFRLFRKQQG